MLIDGNRLADLMIEYELGVLTQYIEVPGVLIHENGYILSIPFRHSGAIAGFIRCIQSHT